MSLDHYEICKASVHGHYEGNYFQGVSLNKFSITSPSTISRLRAVVQFLNTEFAKNIDQNGHKCQISMKPPGRLSYAQMLGEPKGAKNTQMVQYDLSDPEVGSGSEELSSTTSSSLEKPVEIEQSFDPTKCKAESMNREKSLKWVRGVLVRTRGKELVGSYKPHLIGELLWEQSSNWHLFGTHHIDQVALICERFLENLLDAKAPKDVKSRLLASTILPTIKSRRRSAYDELEKLMTDANNFPINYNHYYTDTVGNQRQDRQKAALTECIGGTVDGVGNLKAAPTPSDMERIVAKFQERTDPDMENFSCEEALDCLVAIYKVGLKLCLP